MSILNRDVQVRSDGTWVLPNIPGNQGRIRARAICVDNGATRFGQSNLFTIPVNGSIDVPPIPLGLITPIPQLLTISAPTTTLNQAGGTTQLSVHATYPNGTTADVTAAGAGTDYTVSNSAVVTVTPDGLVTAISNGSALITAFNEGTSGTISIRVGIPPTISITSPVSGATFTEGSTIPVTAVTTGSLAFVKFLVNSQVVSTGVAPPFQFPFGIPIGATNVTLGAQADNGFGDIGAALDVHINVVRDPLTTVIGKVIDTTGLAAAGATVTTAGGRSGTTGTDGSFSISNVRTVFGNITANASFTTASGQVLVGSSAAFAPVLGGTTDVGTFPVRPFSLKVLVVGGEINQVTATDTAEIYDPGSGLWTSTINRVPNAPPASGGSLCATNMTLLGNGKALIAGGGCSDAGVTTNAASLYDPKTNQWTPTASMTFGRDQAGMVTLNQGNALVVDGCAGGCSGPNLLGQSVSTVGRSTEIYNAQTNTWSTAGSTNILRGGLSFGNLFQTMATLPDGRVLLCNGNDAFSIVYSSCEIYDPVTNQWTNTGAIGEPGLHQLIVLQNGKALAVKLDGQSAALFDETTGTWGSTGSLPTKEVSGTLALLSTGEVLISGGTDGVNPVKTAQIYNPGTGTWRSTGSMGAARNAHIAVRLADGRVLVAGGTTSGSTLLSSAEIFDPSTGTWSPTGSMSQARTSANALAVPF